MTLRIGIIALGKISERTHLPLYKEVKGAQVVAACDPDEERALLMQDQFKIPRIYKSYQEMFAHEELDAVSVNSPHRFHAEQAIAAAKRGLHVLVEKPMALSVKDIRAMIAASRKAGKVLMVEQFMRFHPAVYKAREVIQSGKLGKVLTIRGHFGHAGPEYWSPEGKWFLQKKEAQGGTMLDIGVHEMDLMRYISGKQVAQVAAFLGTLKKKIDVEDNAVAILRFDDGTLGTLESSWTNDPGSCRTEFYCEKGNLEMNLSGKDPLVIYRPNKTPQPVSLPKKHPEKSPMAYFVKCIREGLVPHCDGVEGGRSCAVVLMAAISDKEKRIVKVPEIG